MATMYIWTNDERTVTVVAETWTEAGLSFVKILEDHYPTTRGYDWKLVAEVPYTSKQEDRITAQESDKVPYGYDSDKLDGGYYDEG